LAALAVPASALTLDREFRIDPARLQISTANGVTSVDVRGGTHEFAAGRPDLPWVAERVDLPAGMKVTGVEVLSSTTELLRAAVRLAPALSPRPGAGENERTTADARVFSSDAFQPEQLAGLGIQGSLRGRNVAYIRLAPARWNPATGQLERVASLRL